MIQIKEKSFIKTYGSDSLDNLIERLQSTSDPKRRYEYILWLAKSLPLLTEDLHLETASFLLAIKYIRSAFWDLKLIVDAL